MSNDAFTNVISDNIINFKIELNGNPIKKITFKNHKYEESYLKAQAEQNLVSLFDKILVYPLMFLFSIFSWCYLYLNFFKIFFFVVFAIGLFLILVIVFYLNFTSNYLSRESKNRTLIIMFFIFIIIKNANLILVLFNYCGSDTENTKNYCQANNNDNNSELKFNEKFLRIIIYNYIFTSFLIALKFEANPLISISNFIINSITISLSIYKMQQEALSLFIELAINLLTTIILYAVRREWDKLRRKLFAQKIKLDKIQTYIKDLLTINAKNNIFFLNFKQENLNYIDKKLERLFNLDEETGLVARQDTRKQLEKLKIKKNSQESYSAKNTDTNNPNSNNFNINDNNNKNENEVNKKFNFKLDEFLGSLIYYEIPELTENHKNDLLEYSKTKKSDDLNPKSTYFRSQQKLSIISKSNYFEKINLATSTLKNDNKCTLKEKFKEAFTNLFCSENHTRSNSNINKNFKRTPTKDDDLKLRRTKTKILNVSENFFSVDYLIDDYSKARSNYFCCNSTLNKNANNNLKYSNKRSLSNNARNNLTKDFKKNFSGDNNNINISNFSSNNKTHTQNNNLKKENDFEENFEFINLGIYHYSYTENYSSNFKNTKKNQNDFTSKFDILNNLDHFKNLFKELETDECPIINNNNENDDSKCKFENFEEDSAKGSKNAKAKINQGIPVPDEIEMFSENKQIILKNKKIYYNVYFRKIKLLENITNCKNSNRSTRYLKVNLNDIINKNCNFNSNKNIKEEYFVEFVLIDISKEIRYHKKIIKQNIKIRKLQNDLNKELIMPYNNLSNLFNKTLSDDYKEKSKNSLQMINYLDIYLNSNISFNKLFNDNYELKFYKDFHSNLDKKAKMQKIRFKHVLNFLNEVCFDFFNYNNLMHSNVQFDIKSKLNDNVEKYVISSYDYILNEILMQILTKIIKYNDDGVIYIVITEAILNGKQYIAIQFKFTKENMINNNPKAEEEEEKEKDSKLNENNNLLGNDENSIIAKHFKKLFKNEISLRTKKGVNNPYYRIGCNYANNESNYSAEGSVKGIVKINYKMNNNRFIYKDNEGFKSYFLNIYKKTLFKKIVKKENLFLAKIKKLLKSLQMIFEFNNNFIYGKECNLRLLIPFKLEEEQFGSRNNLDNFQSKRFTFKINDMENLSTQNKQNNNTYINEDNQESLSKLLSRQTLINNNSEYFSDLRTLQNNESISSFNPKRTLFHSYNQIKSFNKTETMDNLEFLPRWHSTGRRNSAFGNLHVDNSRKSQFKILENKKEDIKYELCEIESLDQTEIISIYEDDPDKIKQKKDKVFTEDIFKDFPFDNNSINMQIRGKNIEDE